MNLVVRLLLIFVLGNAALFFLLQTPYWMLSVWIFLFLFITVIELIKYVEKNYRILGNFLMGVKQNDFSYIGNIRQNMKDTGLGKAFSHIADMVEGLRLEAETNYQYLQTVVNHVETGIICFDNSGKINLVNKAVYRFLNLQNLFNIEIFQQIDKGFYDLIASLQPGERQLYSLELRGKIYQLVVYATHFRKEKTDYKLVSFNNIKGELEEKEMESWYKLTRVLTHEIMNSAIPISNLSGMVYETLVEDDDRFKDLSELDIENREELKTSLKIIQSRSRGLVSFVNSTRKITKLPAPELRETNIEELLKGVFSLFSQKLKSRHVVYSIEGQGVKERVLIDSDQMEQVFINLLQNAIDAVTKAKYPKITVIMEKNQQGKVFIRFADNGKGMNTEEKENVFVPFFTTKRNGTGIGLTLSRHIVHNHKGKMDVKSEPGKGTEFIITI
jgi:nitrogen fixation/metabolism regulation signal transduction histidine kinase